MVTLPITHWNLQKELRLDKEISRSISWALERGTHKIGYEKNADLMGYRDTRKASGKDDLDC